jgi:hypothetical protein
MFRFRWLTTVMIAVPSLATAEPLPLAETIEGSTGSPDVASYEFTAESTGVLTVIVRANSDVVINVVDEHGLQIEDGYVDTDYYGDSGAEQGAIIIGVAGDYRVRVEPLSGAADFVLAANWLPFEAVARKPDPQGSPDEAIHMGIGKIYSGLIHESLGDRQDWYRVEAARDGVLNVATRTRSSDVVLEYYQDGNFGSSMQRSDQDLDSDGGRESITVQAREGQVYYFVVTAFNSDAEYSIRAMIRDR